MAHFRGTIKGQRGMVSRLGTKSSGLDLTANGWDAGVSVSLYVNDRGEDAALIMLTGGSNGRGDKRIIFDGAIAKAPEQETDE